MAIDFAKTFGARTGMKTMDQKQDLPKAKIWINIGYETGDEKYPFVSLPVGIALDTMEELEIRGRNDEFNAFVAARNDLLNQLKAAAADLKPGETVIIGLEGGLCIQIRRVDQEPEAPAIDQNRFAKSFAFNFKDELEPA